MALRCGRRRTSLVPGNLIQIDRQSWSCINLQSLSARGGAARTGQGLLIEQCSSHCLYRCCRRANNNWQRLNLSLSTQGLDIIYNIHIQSLETTWLGPTHTLSFALTLWPRTTKQQQQQQQTKTATKTTTMSFSLVRHFYNRFVCNVIMQRQSYCLFCAQASLTQSRRELPGASDFCQEI